MSKPIKLVTRDELGLFGIPSVRDLDDRFGNSLALR